jgi:phosphonate transport system substrate-binding protein
MKYNILIVDDEINVAKSLARTLAADAHQIIIASSGQEGLDILAKAEKNFDLVISDQRMPGMTGVEFLTEVGRLYPQITSIMLTGYTDLEPLQEAINMANIYHFMLKPWDADEIRQKIMRALEFKKVKLQQEKTDQKDSILDNFLKTFLLSFILLLFIAFPARAEKITFGVYTSDKPTVMYKKFDPILQYLQKTLTANNRKEELKIKIYPSYNTALRALASGDCDFARFGPASYIKTKEINQDIRLLVMEHKKSKKRFNGVFITRNNSSISSLKGLKGRSFAFGNKLSTIGRYLCQAELVRAGIYASDLKSYNYLGRHDKVALAVAMGKYDAGVVKENTFNKYAQLKGLKIIGSFQNVTKPWIVRADFDEELFLLLQEGLLNLTDPIILKKLKQHGFVKARDEDYDFVRKSMVLSTSFED